MNETQECIREDILRQFNSGLLNDLLLEERVANHLATCRKCETRLSSFPKDSLVHLLSAPNPLEMIDGSQASPVEPSLMSTKSLREAESKRAEEPGTFESFSPENLPVTIDRYFVVRELGSGGFARVYLAHDPQYNRSVAIKVPRQDRLTTAESRRAFLAEARTVAQLVHPHIVPLYDCRELPDGRCIVAMKYIEGTTLRELMGSERLSRRKSLKMIAEIAEALDHAHRQGIWHRDVKPANILLDRDGHPYLSDFGLAIREERQHLHQRELAGTVPYMSPEQVHRGTAHLDGRSDIWSLGVVMYELLTRQRPFRGGSERQLEEEIVRRPHRPVSCHDATIPPRLEDIVDRCLKKEIGERYATAGRLAADLRKYLNRPRLMAIALVSGASLLVLLTVIIATFLGWSDDQRPALAENTGDRIHLTTLADTDTLVWSPGNDLIDVNGFDEKTRKYRLDAAGRSLIRIGTCHSDEIVLKARFQIGGTDVIGQAGVFWAFDRVTGDEGITFSCWALHVGHPMQMEQFNIEIEQLDIGPNAGRHVVVHSRQVLAIPCKKASPADYQIEVRVDAVQVKQVLVNGIPYLDAPVPLEMELGRAWRRLQNTEYGFLGHQGSFSFETFSVDNHLHSNGESL